MDNLIMGVKDFKSINRAAIEINRINVVTGVNGCGKSTLSKILYSFLAANSKKRKGLILNELIREANKIIEYLEAYFDKETLPDYFSRSDGHDEIMEKYDELFEIAEDFKNSLDERKKKSYDVILDKINEINQLLVDEGFGEDNLFTPSMIDDSTELTIYIHSIIESVPSDIQNKLTDVHDLVLNYDFLEEEVKHASFQMRLVTHRLMNLIYGEDGPHNSFEIMLEIFLKEFIKGLDNFAFFIGKDKGQSGSVAFEYFFEKGFIDNVFYVDSVSILDFKYSDLKIMHMDDLFNNLDYLNSKSSNKTQLILEKIEDIIKGSYVDSSSSKVFRTEIPLPEDEMERMRSIESRLGKDRLFKEEELKVKTATHNTASGIKQIGIVQFLLGKNKLTKNDYLIIDEPEVNLHPEWQFKFAEILVLLARDLNINVYLNSHSPFFVEAVDAFTEFYDMQDEINYYLAEESENEGKYDFTKIGSDELYKIYDNLGRPYDLIDRLRLKKHLGE